MPVSMDDSTHSPSEFRNLRRNLRRWYAKHGRVLPWRETRDPYRIWISEIMLQQTTVAAVTPYYERFIDRFPDVGTLADADEHDVLRLWEGLGYYSRARNLHRAAKEIVESHSGELPKSLDELQELPGIGRYTAGAIASFAYDLPAPIVEANTLRLYARLLGYAGDPRSAAGQKTLWQFATDVLPRSAPGEFNQALMELGAKVCTPADPACASCPVRNQCRACAMGLQDSIPAAPRRIAPTEVTEASIAIRKGKRYLLRLRPAGERWAGLWDFPRFEIQHGHADTFTSEFKNRLVRQTEDLTGVKATGGELLTTFKHTVTRYHIQLWCVTADYARGKPADNQTCRWIAPSDFGIYPLSVTGRKFATRLMREF